MPDAATNPAPDLSASARRVPLGAMVAALVIGILVASALALWAHYGSAVFYEVLLAGIAACF